MADQRIKGQDVSVLIVEGGRPLTEIRDVQSLDMEFQVEVLNEGYLGETSDRRDDIYRGFSGSINFHFSSPEILKLARRVIERARGREPGVVINFKATLQFPNGTRTRVLLRDVFFGAIPVSFGDRASYGASTLSFEGEDFSLL